MAGQQYEESDEGNIKDCSSQVCLQIWDSKHKIGLAATVWQLHPDRETYQRLRLTKSTQGIDNGPSTPHSSRASTVTAEEEPVVPASTYDALGKLPDMTAAGIGRRNATFVAAIRLFEDPKAEEPANVKWPKIPTSEEIPTSEQIYDYVAASPLNSRATGKMWETIFLERDLRTDSVSEYTEVSLIGRCLEKILQVDIIPGTFQDDRTLALVSNLFVLPRVDFKSLFWKVRFLPKVYKFLSNLKRHRQDRARPTLSGSDTKEDTNKNLHPEFSKFDTYDRERMLDVAENQLIRILDSVENVGLFLSEVLLSGTDRPTPLLQDSRTPDESEYYYIMITIWYAIKSFPKRNWEFKDILEGFDKLQAKLSCLPPQDRNFGKANKDKIPLLQWYHYGSILSLSRQGILPPSWQTDGLDRKVSRLGRAARIALAAKLLSKSPYSAEHEIVDRLAFLARELDLENLKDDVDTVASLSIRRVKQRDFTRYINPGWLPPHEEGYTSGPWEIHALCHNSRLNVLSLEDEWRTEEVQSYKEKICHFLNSEAMLVSCWERRLSKARKGWLRSEATSVLGSTLLDIHQKMSGPKKPVEEAVQRRHPINQKVDAHVRLTGDGFSPIDWTTSKVVEEAVQRRHLMSRQVELLERLTGNGLPPIEWTTFAPPRQYHPDNFVNSLADTPHLYRPPVTNKMVIPAAIWQYANPKVRRDLQSKISRMPYA
ncbi:hypothetical protein GJ744_011869 [Endocarpon pusillum]|uniref:Uncharacterized protein n=1 Tax=Endocarpon pusillum TaxID=364733 RepID=A0A8H7AFQ8_9EURO|nr:hypothetical protein GJ744_011869 [Endocarpon pusillum]